MTVGERMILYRSRHRITQNQLAERMDEQTPVISKTEREVSQRKTAIIRLSEKMDLLEQEDES